MAKPAIWTRALVVMAAVGVWVAGCGEGVSTESCGRVVGGCESWVAVTVTVDPITVPAGTHTVEVTADGTSLSCAFTFPSPADVAASGVVFVPCPSRLTISFQSAKACTTSQTPTVSTTDCVPIPGKISETIVAAGAPSSVHLRQEVAGTAIVDATLQPTYQSIQPNGPTCLPMCQQGTAELTIAGAI